MYSLNEAKPFSVVDRVTAIIDRRHEETVARRIEASPRIGSLLTDLRLSLDACPELCWRLRGDNAERFAMVLMTTPSGAPYAALGLEYNPGTEARDTAEVFAAMLRCSLAAGMVLNAGK